MRTGKIANLPASIQEEINHRIDQGQPGKKLLAWLNADPRVKEVLLLHFDGRPINAPNLTHWKQGGYAEWQIRQQFKEQSFGSTGSPKNDALSLETINRAAELLSARYLRVLTASSTGFTDSALTEFKQLRSLTYQITALRRTALKTARENLPPRPSQRNARRNFKTRFWHGCHRPTRPAPGPTHTPTPTPTLTPSD